MVEKKSKAVQSNHPTTYDLDISALLKTGVKHHQGGDFDLALGIYEEILRLNPGHVDALQLSGTIAAQRGRWEEAVKLLKRSLDINGANAHVLNNLGNVLKKLDRVDEAIECYKKAIAIKPDYAEAYGNHANLLRETKQFSASLEKYNKAIELKNNYPDAHYNKGLLLEDMLDTDGALACYENAVLHNPSYIDAYASRGDLFRKLKKLPESSQQFQKALDLNSDYKYLLGMLLHTKMFQCDWSEFDANLSALIAKINANKKVAPSFAVLALTDSLEVQRQAAQIWVNDKHPENVSLGPIAKVGGVIKPKIRLGYYSADFHDHATAYLMAELFERHDKSKFELIAFSFGPDKKDAMRQRVSAAFDQFLDVRLKSDKEIAELSRQMGIDIAVDLKGFTQDQRLGIFSYRAAPIQVSYLGYPGTMAAPYIDYLIADRTLIPEESQKHYSEKIVYLPHSYQVNDRQRVIAQKVFTREELGLPKEGFVFCCFNNNFKITPATFDGWVRVLKAVEGSVLWLLEDNMAAGRNLRKEAQARGLDPNRLVFAKRMKLPEHLARHRAADLFLDTLPYNAHTTASDALWAGLPVLTCMGESFASRVAASLLNAIELPELITDTQQEYEALAIELAKDSDKLKGIRDKLERNRLTTPLFDTNLFTQHIEDAFTKVYQGYLNGLELASIYVEQIHLVDSKTDQHSNLQLQPSLSQQAGAKLQAALTLHNAGNLDQASAIYQEILLLEPEHFDSIQLLGAIAAQHKKWDRAYELLTKALTINSANANVYRNLGIVLKELHRLQDSLECFNKAIELKHDYAQAYSNRGIVLREMKLLDQALMSYDKAIEINPDLADAHYNRANVLKDLTRYVEALASYDKSLELRKDNADAYSNRGVVFLSLGQRDQALLNFEKAIEVNNNYERAHNNRGNLLKEIGRVGEALASYDKAIEIRSDYAEAYNNRGNLLRETKQLEKSLESYAKALEISPDYEYLLGMLLHTKMFQCDWSEFDANLSALIAKINANKKVAPSFAVLALTDSLEVQRQAAQIWVNDKHPENASLGPIAKVEGIIKPKIRLGYYSADFHDHATAYLMAELFERHDKSKFELIAFSFGPDKKDAMRQRVSAAFDQFLDVRLKSDKEIAELSREMGIDIAVDLKGFTQDQRLGIFSYRAAPIQVSYLGYPGTMAAPYIDYLIADRTLIPEESQRHYSEKIVYLPHSYQVNDRQRVIAQKVFTREELGLPKEGFVFCCFNNNFKITPATFDGWVRVLKAVEGSVLWLLEDNMAAGRNLRKEAQARGLDPNRLVFAKRMKLPEHLARHRAADLFLDTLPYNAHTTASDALWAGLPVLTCMGESFASRVAASLLNAIELPELITDTQQEYEALAIELAKDSDKLKGIRDKLERNRLTTPLFDTNLFTKHIEMAYKQAYVRYFEDTLPEQIQIKS